MKASPCCLNCHYELTGFAVGDTCPECGNEIRSLYESQDTPLSAKFAVCCGWVGLLALFLGFALFKIIGLLWLGLSVVGVAAALVARIQIRTSQHSYSTSSLRVVRWGFWLCVPGVFVVITVPLFIVFRFIILIISGPVV